jgi:sulfur relay (sulfurtransferase) complex TusBCD TusD component (DsrE family)
MSMTAIVVFSDPTYGGEEALGRLLNAMFLTLELKEKGQAVELLFQGTGTRWPSEIVKPAHPAHQLFQAIADKVAGVCGGCADVFGAAEGAAASGIPLIREKAIAGTSGIADLSRYLDDGARIITF